MERRGRGDLKAFALFAALSFLLLALIPLLAALIPNITMDFAKAGASAEAETGIAWTSSLLNVTRLAFVEPSLWLLILAAAVPSLAAILIVWTLSGSRSVWDLLARFSPFYRRSDEERNIFTAYIVLPVFLIIATLLIRIIRTMLWADAGTHVFQPLNISLLIPVIIYAFLDQGAVLEELGWRGFAGPSLEACGYGWLAAAICVGILWGLWHVPRDVVSSVPSNLGWGVYAFIYLPAFTLKCVAVSVAAAAAMKVAGGSIWPAIIAHGITNDAVGLGGQASIDVALTPAHQISGALPVCIAAFLTVFLFNYSQRSQPN